MCPVSEVHVLCRRIVLLYKSSVSVGRATIDLPRTSQYRLLMFLTFQLRDFLIKVYLSMFIAS